MCAVSAVGDYWQRGLPQKPYYGGIQPIVQPGGGGGLGYYGGIQPIVQPGGGGGLGAIAPQMVSKAEFDALKRDMEELKKLLAAAKRYDEEAGEPNCEMEEKVGLIKKLAELVGVSVDDIFGAAK